MPSRDSSYTYIHFHKPHHAELFDVNSDFNRTPHLPSEDIYVPPEHQPSNPEDEDDVVPDQHAAFGIQQATQKKKKAEWKDLGLEELMRKGPKGNGEVNGVKNALEGRGIGAGGSAGPSMGAGRRGWGSLVIR